MTACQRFFNPRGSFLRHLAPLSLAALCATAQADIVVRGTRVIFPGMEREVTVQLDNAGPRPELVQVWLDQGQRSGPASDSEALFVVAPALFRVEPGRGQTLRILRSRQPLPTDRETLFWLNILEVPHKPKAEDAPGALRFVFSTRIKLMYRPPGLPGHAKEAPARLQWALARDSNGQPTLQATNPTTYVVNLGGVDLRIGTRTFEAGYGHVLPGETATFPVQGTGVNPLGAGAVLFSSLDDWGAPSRHEAPVLP